jgi:hypothetical protein
MATGQQTIKMMIAGVEETSLHILTLAHLWCIRPQGCSRQQQPAEVNAWPPRLKPPPAFGPLQPPRWPNSWGVSGFSVAAC